MAFIQGEYLKMKEKTKYAAVVDVSRKEIDNGKYIRFAADVRFANGAVITKYMDVPPHTHAHKNIIQTMICNCYWYIRL